MSKLKNIFKSYVDMQNHFFSVKIAGKDAGISLGISYLEFDANIWGEASVCVIRWQSGCYNSDGEFTFNDDFYKSQIGAKLEVSAGYLESDLKLIFSGFVFSFSFVAKGGTSFLEISGMDGKMWMMANSNTQFKGGTDQKFSKIVKDIQNKYSSKFSKSEIDIPNEPDSIYLGIHQRDETDFEYLRRIADITGSFFYVSDGKFMFVPMKSKGTKITVEPIGKIDDGNLIEEVSFTSNIVGIPKSVSVSFTSNEDYTQTNSSEVQSFSKIGNGDTADSLTSNLSDDNSINIINEYTNSSDCAKFIANATYMKTSIHFAKCRIVCKFLHEIKIGAPVEMSGFGDVIDNSYIVTSLNHKYDRTDFKTTIELSADSFSQGASGGFSGGISKFKSFF